MTKRKSGIINRLCGKELQLFHLGSVLSLLVLAIGLLCHASDLPRKFLDSKLHSILSLSPESPMYSDWINPPVPIYMMFHIFNVTNPEEIVDGGKPKVKECGPYIYRMSAPKFNVTFHSNDTVSFFNNHILIFQPDMSRGGEDDVLFHLNVPLVSLSFMTKNMIDYFGLMGKMVDMAGGSDLFIKHTAFEILFGYRDPIFSMLNKFAPFIGQRIDPIFGFFHKFNNSDDGSYLVYTGKSNYRRAHSISKWNGQQNLNFWSSKYANMINGTDGSFFGFNVTPNDKRYIYFPQMCRSMELEYENNSEIKGVTTLKFHPSIDFWANSTVNENNLGFCVPTGNCYDSGVLNVQSCMEGAPGFISLPHFYNAAHKYQTAVMGLTPEKDKHDSVFHVEPNSGAVLRSHRRIQINILMQPSNRFKNIKYIQETIFPILWLDGSAEVDDSVASNLRMFVEMINVADAFSYLLVGLGCLILFTVIFCALKTHRDTKFRRSLPGSKTADEAKCNKSPKDTCL